MGKNFMKLKIVESDYTNLKIYIDIIHYRKSELYEDTIEPDFIFKKDYVYQNELDTKWYILTDYIVPIAKNLKRDFQCIESYNVRSSSPDTSGLSNYIDIVFTHPEDSTEQEILDNYTYTIRFSDHENQHPEYNHNQEVDIIGKKAKNLEKAARKVFLNSLTDIQNDIKNFEIERFGEQETFLK